MTSAMTCQRLLCFAMKQVGDALSTIGIILSQSSSINLPAIASSLFRERSSRKPRRQGS